LSEREGHIVNTLIIRVPRVRKGSFCSVILPERRKAGLDLAEVVISLYASGISIPLRVFYG
jgi:transposase-like protein